jgi:hypothetical protein
MKPILFSTPMVQAQLSIGCLPDRDAEARVQKGVVTWKKSLE